MPASEGGEEKEVGNTIILFFKMLLCRWCYCRDQFTFPLVALIFQLLVGDTNTSCGCSVFKCQYSSGPVVPASYLSTICTWQIHFSLSSLLLMFLFKTSQLSSPLTGCLSLHKREFAPLPIGVKNVIFEINCKG